MNFNEGDSTAHSAFRREMENWIHRNIKVIAKQSSLVGVDNAYWDVNRVSWTGEEWLGFLPIEGICYVEAFEHSIPPHDFIYVVSVRSGTPCFLASYEGDVDFFQLTIYRLDAESLGLPEQVPR